MSPADVRAHPNELLTVGVWVYGIGGAWHDTCLVVLPGPSIRPDPDLCGCVCDCMHQISIAAGRHLRPVQAQGLLHCGALVAAIAGKGVNCIVLV